MFESGTPPKINKQKVGEDKSHQSAKKRKIKDKEKSEHNESPKKKKKKNDESGYISSLPLDEVIKMRDFIFNYS